jgi:hypothetical protein
MDVVLETHSSNPALALRDVRWFGDSSGYVSQYVVQSGSFAAARPFYFEAQPLATFLEALEEMDRTLQGAAELRPLFEPEFLRLSLDHTGHIEVTGELVENGPSYQSLNYSFQTDQTCLKPFIAALKEVVVLQRAGVSRVAP